MVRADRRSEIIKRLVELALAAPLPAGSRSIRGGPSGSLVVHEGYAWRGRTVWVDKRKGYDRLIATVQEYEIDGALFLAAVFPDLRPGTHRVREMDMGEEGRTAEVLIDVGRVVSLDWS